MKWAALLLVLAALFPQQAIETDELRLAGVRMYDEPTLAVLATDHRFMVAVGYEDNDTNGLFEYVAVAVNVSEPIIGGQAFFLHDGILDSIEVAPDFGLEIIEQTDFVELYGEPVNAVAYAWGTEFGGTPPQGDFVACFVMSFIVPPCQIIFDIATDPPARLTSGGGVSIPVTFEDWDCQAQVFENLVTRLR